MAKQTKLYDVEMQFTMRASSKKEAKALVSNFLDKHTAAAFWTVEKASKRRPDLKLVKA